MTEHASEAVAGDDATPKDFEDALSRLERIVQELERGDLSLETSLLRYEQGVKLAKFCTGKLEEADKRVEMLSIDDRGEPRRDREGKVRTTPLELDE